MSNNPTNGTDPTGLCGFLGDGPCTPGGIKEDISEKCIDFGGNDECNTIEEQHPESMQHIRNFAGGVLEVNPITAFLPLDLEGHGVATDSGWADLGSFSMALFQAGMGWGNGSIIAANTLSGWTGAWSSCTGGTRGECAGAVFSSLIGTHGAMGTWLQSPGLYNFFNAFGTLLGGVPWDRDGC